ncbi:protein adenylyltransferase SelO, mitochondrial-like [Colias croceus]|uniref:protein adenylyltransferase SelO, mitochondrial-like n=1 Tax=Colias crocea TaxID=72248 RepID=UPI001E27C781|nr:protein adenylyltransferase SelO, mitochondrial-like [Colias croceus]
MKRGFSTFHALLHNPREMMLGTKLINDFKDFKFKSPPSYAELPINENPEYNVPVAVNHAIFSKVPTEPLTGKLHLVCVSEDALIDVLDLDPKVSESEEFIHFVSGKYLPEGGLSVSHRYGGYQFGYWADQLGDGRAHILGEYVNRKGETWQPQLKGSGETPYSRFGDGRAVLRSSIREMIASEACYYLGIPTTRAGALVVSDDHKVWRDKTYSGMARQERAAIVVRLSPAWYRIGSFEILYKRREPELAAKLADFIIKHHFPEISLDDEDRYVKLYSEVAHRNLDMVATWQGIGFTHGVLNTDNISLLGLTIDYGPYGFIDHYYDHYVPNSSDDMGRYAYKMQPEILLWNLDKFAEALVLILKVEQIAKIRAIQATLDEYVEDKIRNTFNLKLGLENYKDGDEKLVKDLLSLMQSTMADFTATFRQLAEINLDQLCDEEILKNHWSLIKLCKAKGWDEWVKRYRERIDTENVTDEKRKERMLKVNPLYVPRNWILQEAIADAEKNDFKKVRHLLEVFKKPFEVNEEAEKLGYSSQPPSWSYGLKLSCSS